MTWALTFKFALGTTLIFLLAVSPALPQHICWVQKVDKSAAGVDIHFTSKRWVDGVHAGHAARYIIDPTTHVTSTDQYGSTTAPVLHLDAGDSFWSMNSPEDMCSGKVLSRDGSLGVDLSASFHPPFPPGAGSDLRDFVAADVTTTP